MDRKAKQPSRTSHLGSVIPDPSILHTTSVMNLGAQPISIVPERQRLRQRNHKKWFEMKNGMRAFHPFKSGIDDDEFVSKVCLGTPLKMLGQKKI